MTGPAIRRERSHDYNILTGKIPPLTRRILANHRNPRLLDFVCSHLVTFRIFPRQPFRLDPFSTSRFVSPTNLIMYLWVLDEVSIFARGGDADNSSSISVNSRDRVFGWPSAVQPLDWRTEAQL
jgi:hypothetical protein